MYHEEGSLRSLDLTCETEREFEYWYFGIKVGTLMAYPLHITPPHSAEVLPDV